jgi:hypothetical protein
VTRAALLAILLAALAPQDRPKPYRLPATDLKQRVIWGATCEVPDGPSLAFGGQDQQAEDGNPHTRIKVDGQWKSIYDDLRAANPEQQRSDEHRAAIAAAKAAQAQVRFGWFEGKRYAPVFTATNVERFDCEPAPRALSPIAFDAKTKLFVIFGGDHLDYLMNDTWVFDPEKRKWTKRLAESLAPPPRANHTLKADGDGKIVLSGGYTYTSSTDYVGGQFRDHADGDWVYDIVADRWTGKGVVRETKVYRSGRLHPDYYQQGPLPDPKAFADWLAAVPVNSWTLTRPPQLPALNRDWGTAVLDPDRDLILRWSGGHSAHGGTDVLQYHMNTNRWELPNPVEFPLGQLYSNTEYPEGWNFNHRPWITGHTYQNYGYDPNLKKMLFTGRREHCYVYDPDLGDWTTRFAKPKGMIYDSSFYTLTITSTPQGLVCWTHDGKLFRYRESEWKDVELRGKLPGSVVDNSTVIHDSKRDRLLFARKAYGDKAEYDGVLHAVDLKSGEVSALAPSGKEKAGAIPYLCQLRYDSTNDLVLGGCTLPPDADGVRRTPAYDCGGDRWVSLKIGGDDPSGKKGRNVSMGMMYDAKRKLFWAVDTNSNVYVLRLDVAAADLKPL